MTYGQMRSPEQVDLDRKILNRVLAGIEFLQDTYGDEWVDKIDLETFRIRDGDRCVLGQIEGCYITAVERLGLEGTTSSLGFSTGTDGEWKVLQKVWVDEITSRKTPDTSGV